MNFRQLVIYGTIVLFVASCYKYNEPEKPKNLISKDKMVNILIDLKLINSGSSKDKRTMKNVGVDQEYIFSKYNIDSLQFALSNAYYAFHVEEYEAIYSKAKDSLEGLNTFYQDLLDKEEALKKKKKDSIAAVKKARKDSISKAKKVKDSLKLLIKKKKAKVK